MAKLFDQVKEYCEEHQGQERLVIIAGIVKTFNVTQTTAVTYYHKWKREYMHSENVIPKPEPEPIPVKYEKPRDKFVFVEKPRIEADKSESTGLLQDTEFTSEESLEFKEELPVDNEPLSNEEKKVLEAFGATEEEIEKTMEELEQEMKPDSAEPKLKILMIQGETLTYTFSEDGIKIVDSKSDMLTEDLILEQQAVLKMYNETWG